MVTSPAGIASLGWLRESLLLALLCILPDAVYWLRHESILAGDTLTSNLPLKALAAEQLGQGRVPLWTSRLGCGSPLLADTIALPFDWRNFWWLLLSPFQAYWAMVLTSRVLGAVVCLHYFRLRHGFRFWPAALATLVYFSSTVYFGESRLHSTAVSLDGLPAILWLTERLMDRTTLRRVLGLAFAWALLFSMGSVAYLVYLPVLALVWILGLWIFHSYPYQWMRLVRFGLGFGTSLAWAMLLSGVAVLPFIELTTLSNRGGEYPADPFAFRSLWFALVGAHYPNSLVPEFNYFFYVGVVSLPLFVSALARRDNPYLRLLPWLSALTLSGIVLMTSPAKPKLVALVPMLATCSFFRFSFLWGWLAAVGVGYALQRAAWREIAWVRWPTRFLYYIQLVSLVALALLIVWLGMLRVDGHPVAAHLWPHVKVLVASSFMLLIVLRCWGLRQFVGQSPLAPWKVHVALLLELLVAWATVRPVERPVGGYYPWTPELAYLRAHIDPNYRTMELVPSAQNPRPVIPVDRPLYSLFLDTQAYQGLYTANVYESLIPRQLSAVFEDIGDLSDRRKFFPRATNAIMITSDQESGILDALAVKYLVSMQELPPSPEYTLRVKGTAYYVYERNDPVPRAYFVSRAARLPEPSVHQRLREISRGRADNPLKHIALITDGAVAAPLRVRLHGGGTETDSASPTDARPFVAAKVVRDQDELVEVSLDAPDDGYLILADTHFPGWKARVDGVDSRVEVANGFGRAVAVTRGCHRICFAYEPVSYRAGLFITLGALGLSMIGLAISLCSSMSRRTVSARGPESRDTEVERPHLF